MKKNKMMRLASSLLVAVLLTSSVISGTFAKYVTADDATDSARVAKWGVLVEASGSLFSQTYVDEAGGNVPGSTDVTVKVGSTEVKNLVAPGTQNNDGISFSIKGTPEVAVNVKVNFTSVEHIFLTGGTYKDMTDGDRPDVTVADYEPVVFTLKQTTYNDDGTVKATTTTDYNYADLKTALSIDADYAPNTNLAGIYGDYQLTWTWVFGDSANNVADTILGSIAADTYPETLTDGTDYNLDTEVTFDITVSQID